MGNGRCVRLRQKAAVDRHQWENINFLLKQPTFSQYMYGKKLGLASSSVPLFSMTGTQTPKVGSPPSFKTHLLRP